MNSYIYKAPAWTSLCARVLVVVACLLVITYRSQAQTGQWTTNGNNINNTNSGNVGVGTTTPSDRLSAVVDDAVNNGITQVFSVGHMTSGTPAAGLGSAFGFRAKRSDGALAQIGYIAGVWEDPTNSFEDGALIFAPVLNSLGFGTERMRITSIGRVGIGTSNPVYSLDVAGGVNGLRAKAATVSADDAVATFENDNGIQLMVRGNGNVGIGTSSPATKLHVAGSITVDGNINAKYQDVAEWVESSQALAAGTVVVLDRTRSNQVIASTQNYDTRVAGVISSSPGLTLGEQGEGKVLVATTGRVKVRVSAKNGPIEIGDLLVTSDQQGVAMKSEAVNIGGVQIHRPGTLIGKALEPLLKGEGEILVLLSLQ